jgi:DHA3 family macrolide efflux protein-like MFS transporter
VTFGKLTFPLLAALGFVMGCFVPQFEAAVNASIDQLVDEDRLASATAIQSSTIEFSNIIAATASTSIIALGGIQLAYWVNLALYLVGALFLVLVKTKLYPKTSEEGSDLGYFEDIKHGISYIWHTVEMRWFVLVFALESFFIVPIFILIPLLVKTNLNSQIAWVAVFETVLSIGAVIITVLMSFKSRYRHFYPTFAVSLIALGLLLWLLGRVSHPYVMAAILFGLGSLFAAMMSLSYMMFQHVVPGELKGRFFGVVGTVAAGMAPLSYMLVGLLSDVMSLSTVLLINGLGSAAVALVVLWIPRLMSHLGPDEDGSLGSVEAEAPH